MSRNYNSDTMSRDCNSPSLVSEKMHIGTKSLNIFKEYVFGIFTASVPDISIVN